MEIPMVWLVVSGVFFGAGIVLNLVLAYAVLQLVRMVKEMQPKLLSTVESVEQVSKRVDEIAAKVSTTVDAVGGGAQSLAKTVNVVSKIGNKNAGLINTVLAAGMAIFKLYQEVESYRTSRRKSSSKSVDNKQPDKA